MSKYSGLIQLDYGIQRETIYFPSVPSLSQFTAFLEVFKTFTNAGVRKYAHTVTEYLHESGEGLQSEDIDEVLMIQLEYLDNDEIHRTLTLPVPAPKRDLLTFVEGVGYRLLADPSGDTFAQAYSTLTGKNYTFKNGWLLA
jgi:hypothetical protein